jgi:hypothetical protein
MSVVVHKRQRENLLHGQTEYNLLLVMLPRWSVIVILSSVGLVMIGFSVAAQTDGKKDWTASEDHQNMMAQLGIKALRPGPSGNENAANHANYDEATANPFPNLPDVLTLRDGKKVTTEGAWWNQRRPEIVEDFEREVLGRIPKKIFR